MKVLVPVGRVVDPEVTFRVATSEQLGVSGLGIADDLFDLVPELRNAP